MERIKQKAGVPAIVALLAAAVILYSLWGASVLRQQQASSQDSNGSVATNL